MEVKLPKKLRIEITEEDARKAKAFTDGSHCLVATAFRRQRPKYRNFIVGGWSMAINDGKYYFDGAASDLIHGAYHKHINPRRFKGFKPFVIIAIRKD